MKDLNIYCDEYDFSSLAQAFSGEFKSDCNIACEVVFATEEEIRTLNREQRNTDKVTDVLSFPSLDGICRKKIKKRNHIEVVDENGNVFIGSIVICVKRAEEQAAEYGHTYFRELHYLVTHGVCHLLGYDHMEEADKKLMRAKEEKVLTKMGITR